jgi:hypothetical protein
MQVNVGMNMVCLEPWQLVERAYDPVFVAQTETLFAPNS